MSSTRLYANPAFVVFWSARTVSCRRHRDHGGSSCRSWSTELTGSAAAVAALTRPRELPVRRLRAYRRGVSRPRRPEEDDGRLERGGRPAAGRPYPGCGGAARRWRWRRCSPSAFGIGTAFVWFDAANFGSVPALVDRAQLPTAMSMIASSGTLALLIGPALGGFLLTIMAPPYALGFDAGSYLISAFLLASIRRPFRKPQRTREVQLGRTSARILPRACAFSGISRSSGR